MLEPNPSEYVLPIKKQKDASFSLQASLSSQEATEGQAKNPVIGPCSSWVGLAHALPWTL